MNRERVYDVVVGLGVLVLAAALLVAGGLDYDAPEEPTREPPVDRATACIAARAACGACAVSLRAVSERLEKPATVYLEAP